MRVGKARVALRREPPDLRRPATPGAAALGVDQALGLQLGHLLAHRLHRDLQHLGDVGNAERAAGLERREDAVGRLVRGPGGLGVGGVVGGHGAVFVGSGT